MFEVDLVHFVGIFGPVADRLGPFELDPDLEWLV